MIERTIRQLEVADRSLLTVASLQGHEFDAWVLARSIGADPARIEERLDLLRTIHAVVRIEIGHRRGSDDAAGTRYSFVHSLYREALYASLPEARKVLLSGSVAHALLERHRNHVSDIASTLAVLFETACDGARAAEYALVAARNAAGMSGYREAIALARRGLRMLESVPPSPEHTYKRLMLLATLAAALGATEGYGTPEVREAYQSARSLCRHSSEWLYLVPTLIGLWSVHASRGEFEPARELGRHLLTTSEEADAPGLRARAHVMHGGALGASRSACRSTSGARTRTTRVRQARRSVPVHPGCRRSHAVRAR